MPEPNVYTIDNLETVMTVLGNEAKRYRKLADEATDSADMKEALHLCVAIQDGARKICTEFQVDYAAVYVDFFQSW
jgi:hypothetical protein